MWPVKYCKLIQNALVQNKRGQKIRGILPANLSLLEMAIKTDVGLRYDCSDCHSVSKKCIK